jgi:hypothetical protein
VSDLDPSGLDLQRAWEEALANFHAPIAAVVRIGLTRAQVIEHGLDRLAIAVKPSDSRTSNFITEHGDRCWETDILPAAVSNRPWTSTSHLGSIASYGSDATAKSNERALFFR